VAVETVIEIVPRVKGVSVLPAQVGGQSRPIALDKERRRASLTAKLVEPGALAQYEEAWCRLSSRAIAPNAFYEPWVILPASQYLAGAGALFFLLIFGPPDAAGEKPLWGFFPLEVQSRCLGVPVKTLAFWQHRYCFLATPLIELAHTREVLDTFWRWFERNPLGCRILDTNYLLAEGAFHEIWADFATRRTALVLNDYPRAFLDPRRGGIPYSSMGVSKKHMDEYIRQERRLRELGALEYRQVTSSAEVDSWIADFLHLEAAGWKGEHGDAIAKQSADISYLRAVTREGFARGRVMLLSLNLIGKPIAMKYNLLSQDGGFAFKIAFDEHYGKYSPGVLLEFDNIRRVCGNPSIQWMDSCALARHPMLNRLWNERRMIRRTLFSNNKRLSDFCVSALPLLRWIGRQVWHRPIPDNLQISTTQKELKP
jgi:hypothetical protein